MKIFLTGGSGFIGKNLLESLGSKYDIMSPSHKELDLLDADAVKDFFKQDYWDIVIHSAVKPGHRIAADFSKILFSNTSMFFNLVRNSDRFGKMLFLSSGAAYDMNNYLPKMKEEYFDVHVPVDDIGLSKYISAKYIELADKIVELRVFGVFGKYEDYAIRFISNAICKAIFDLPITIKQNRVFDYLFTDDLAKIVDFFIINNSKFKAYNITPDESYELKTLAEKVLQISRKDLPIKIAKDGLGIEYTGTNDRLRQEIPNLKFTYIDNAIQQLYKWYLLNKDKIDKEVLLTDR